MDGGQQGFDGLVQNLVFLREAIFSQDTLRLLNKHIFSSSSSLNVLRRQASETMAPLLAPLAARLHQLFLNSPDIVLLFLVVLLFVLAVQVLAWIRRMLLWITGLIFKLALWAAVAAGVAFMWQRGPEQTVRDFAVLVSKIAGYGASLKDVWLAEYQRYDGQQNIVGGAGGGGAAANNYGYYGGRGR
ncbi:hypothetical protein BD289DRAFT_455828 [Coniella lustricola]|uniref:Nuclear pore assembly and biogenesis-domain-containing protein n=1 Tax=Coniella lustricola TaxID=2025994 RepID=A0A2T2ZYA9_9PEZI|nr:hypothetical protein BD289DRAFT_455828 [Coniella lustricola]